MFRKFGVLSLWVAMATGVPAQADVAIPLIKEKGARVQLLDADPSQAVLSVKKDSSSFEIWHTNGSPEGTRLLGTAHADTWRTLLGSAFYYERSTCSLFRATENGGILKLAEACGVEGVESFLEADGRVYFMRDGQEVWGTDGTPEGTKRLLVLKGALIGAGLRHEAGYVLAEVLDSSSNHVLQASNFAGEQHSLNLGVLFGNAAWAPSASIFLSGRFYFTGTNPSTGETALYQASAGASSASLIDALPAGLRCPGKGGHSRFKRPSRNSSIC